MLLNEKQLRSVKAEAKERIRKAKVKERETVVKTRTLPELRTKSTYYASSSKRKAQVHVLMPLKTASTVTTNEVLTLVENGSAESKAAF